MEDIEKMIACDGVDSTLEKLRMAGVYLSLEEFKGIKDVIRHGRFSIQGKRIW